MHAINKKRSLLKLSIALYAAAIALVCGAAVYADTKESMQWVPDSNLGLWSPPATMREWSNAHPTGAYAIADISFPQGDIHYGAHGETTPMMTIGTNPGVRWPELIGPFSIQGSEHLRARWAMMNKVFGPGLQGEPGALPLTCNWAATAACVSAQMEAEIENSPELAMDRAKEEQNQANQTSADTNATMTRQNAGSAIDYVAHYLYNFTVDEGNRWNIVRNQLFLPMAILILLPGTILAQMKAIVSAGNPVVGIDIASPFDGILRAIVAIFLIPGTYLFINYGIDIANSITYEIATEYMNIFGTDMYKDAMSAEVRAFPLKNVSENKGYVPNQVAKMGRLLNGPDTPFAEFEGNNIEVKIEDPVAGIYIDPADRANEMVPYEVNSQRNVYNTANAGLALSWNIMCAFQQAYLYYLWFAGPVVAALWVYPMSQLRQAFPNWVQGVVCVCFWSLFWSTVVLLMACWRGCDETGTLMMSALNFLATASVKTAFDFAGLAKQAGAQAMHMAQSAGKSSAGAAGKQGQGGKNGSSSQSGGTSPAAAALAGAFGVGASAVGPGSAGVGTQTNAAGQPSTGAGNGGESNTLSLLNSLVPKSPEAIRLVAPSDVAAPPLSTNVGAGDALLNGLSTRSFAPNSGLTGSPTGGSTGGTTGGTTGSSTGGTGAASFAPGSGSTGSTTGNTTGDSTSITDLPDNFNLSTNNAVLGADGKLAAFNGINIDKGNQLHSHNLSAPHLSLGALHNLTTNGPGAAAMAAQIAAANGAFVSGGNAGSSQFISASDIANNNLPADVADRLSSYDVDNNIDFGDTTMVAGSGAFGASAIAVDLPTGAPPLATSGVVPTGGSSGQGQDSLPPLTSSASGSSSTTDAAGANAAREGQQHAAAAHAAAQAAAQANHTSFSQTNGDQVVNQGRDAAQAAQQQAVQAAQQQAMQAAQQQAAQAQQTAIQQATAAASQAAAAQNRGASSGATNLVPGSTGNDVTNLLANDFVNLLDPTKGIVAGSGSTTIDGASNAAALSAGLSSIMSAPLSGNASSVGGTFVDQDNNITLVGGIPQSASGGTLLGGGGKSGETAGSTSFGKFLADGFHKADQRFTNEFSGQNADKMRHLVQSAGEHPASGHGMSLHPATATPASKDGVAAQDAGRHGQHTSTVHGAGAILPPPPPGNAGAERSSSGAAQTAGVAGSGSVAGTGSGLVAGGAADVVKQGLADDIVNQLDPTKGIVPNGTDTETVTTSSPLSNALGSAGSYSLGSTAGASGTASGAPQTGGTVIDSDTNITLASGLAAIPAAASGTTQVAGGNGAIAQTPGGNAMASSSASTGGLAAGGAVGSAAGAESNTFARQLAEGFHKSDQRFTAEFSGQNVGNMQKMVQSDTMSPHSGNVMGVPGAGEPVLGGNSSTSATAREANQAAQAAGSVVQPPTSSNAGTASSRELGAQTPASGAGNLVQGGAPADAMKQALANDMVNLLDPTKGIVPNGAGSESIATGGSTASVSPSGTSSYALNSSASNTPDAGSASPTIVDSDTNITLASGLPPVSAAGAGNVQTAGANGSPTTSATLSTGASAAPSSPNSVGGMSVGGAGSQAVSNQQNTFAKQMADGFHKADQRFTSEFSGQNVDKMQKMVQADITNPHSGNVLGVPGVGGPVLSKDSSLSGSSAASSGQQSPVTAGGQPSGTANVPPHSGVPATHHAQQPVGGAVVGQPPATHTAHANVAGTAASGAGNLVQGGAPADAMKQALANDMVNLLDPTKGIVPKGASSEPVTTGEATASVSPTGTTSYALNSSGGTASGAGTVSPTIVDSDTNITLASGLPPVSGAGAGNNVQTPSASGSTTTTPTASTGAGTTLSSPHSVGGMSVGGAGNQAVSNEQNTFAKQMADGFHKADQRFTSEFSGQNVDKMQKMVQADITNPHSGNVLGVPGVGGPVLSKDSSLSGSSAASSGHQSPVAAGGQLSGTAHVPPHVPPHSGVPATHHAQQPVGGAVVGQPPATHTAQANVAGTAASGAGSLVQGGAPADAMKQAMANDMVNLLDPTKGIVPKGASSEPVTTGEATASVSPTGMTSYALNSSGTASGAGPVSPTIVDSDTNITLASGLPPVSGAGAGNNVQTPSANGSTTTTPTASTGAGTTLSSPHSVGGMSVGGAGNQAVSNEQNTFAKQMADGFHKADQRFTSEFSGQNVDKMQKMVQADITNPHSGNVLGVPGVGGPVLSKESTLSGPDAGSSVHQSHVTAGGQPSGTANVPPHVPPHSGVPATHHAQQPVGGAVVGQPPATHMAQANVAGTAASATGNLVQGGAPADAMKQAMANDMVNLLDPTKGIVPKGASSEPVTSGGSTASLPPSGTSSYALNSSGSTASGAGSVSPTIVDADTNITLASGLPPVSGATSTGASNVAAGGSPLAPAESNTFAKQMAEGFHKADQRFTSEFSGQNVGNMQKMVQDAVDNPRSGNVMGVPGVGGPVLNKEDATSTTAGADRMLLQSGVQQPPMVASGTQKESTIANGPAPRNEKSATTAEMMFKKAAEDMVNFLDPTKNIVPGNTGSTPTTGNSTSINASVPSDRSAPAERGITPPQGSSVLSQALSLGLPTSNTTPTSSIPTTGKMIADGLYNKGVEHAERFASQNVAGMTDQVRSAVENPHSPQAREQTADFRAASAIPGGSALSASSDLKMAPPAAAKQDDAEKAGTSLADGLRQELTKQAVDGVVDQLDPVKGIVPVFGPVEGEGSGGDQSVDARSAENSTEHAESLAKASQALSAADKATAVAGGASTARVEQTVWQERMTDNTAPAPAPIMPIPAVRPTVAPDPLRFAILNGDRRQALDAIDKSSKKPAPVTGSAAAKDKKQSPKSTSRNTTTKAKKVSSVLDRALKDNSTQKPSAQPPAAEKKRVKDPMAGVPHDNTLRRYRSKRKVTSEEWSAMERLAPDAKSSAPQPDEQA